MTPEEAIDKLREYNRHSVYSKFAGEVCEAFDLKLSEKLIRKPGVTGYREMMSEEGLKNESVVVSSLAEWIASEKGLKPDYSRANRMFGIGSMHSATTDAACKALEELYNCQVDQ